MNSSAEYGLLANYLQHWLVAGPASVQSVTAGHKVDLDAILAPAPVELGNLNFSDTTLSWAAYHTKLDHFLIFPHHHQPTDHCLVSWGYSEITSSDHCTGQIFLAGFTAVDLWLNNQLIFQTTRTSQVNPWQADISAKLSQGKNTFLIRLVTRSGRLTPASVALRLDFNSEMKVNLPLATDSIERSFFERAFEAAYTDRYVYNRDERLVVRWPNDYTERCILDMQVRQAPNRVFGMVEATQVEANQEIPFLQSYDVADGAYQLCIMPKWDQYSVMKLRVKRDIPIYFARNKYHFTAEDPLVKRADELVRWAYQQVDDLWGQAAQLAAGRWNLVNFDVIIKTAVEAASIADPIIRLCLLGIYLRYSAHSSFPQDLRERINASILEWNIQTKAVDLSSADEGDELILAVVEMLAGQLFEQKIFAQTGQTGQFHAQQGINQVQSWLTLRARRGFKDWNTSDSIDKIIAGLTHIIDLAHSEDLSEMAGVVLDKLFFTLAIHQFKGIFGAPRMQAAVPQIFGAFFDSLSGISRLMWGPGVYTTHLAGAVSLLCTAEYSMPDLIGEIALDIPDELWMKECPSGSSRKANIAIYKTPEAMLTSVENYAPGKPGRSELLWQATLAPDAVVFTSSPSNFSLLANHQPNFWAGNATNPWIHQWKGTLICHYQLPPENWCGFTHAYFPEAAFEQVDFVGKWAFAAKDEAYIALMASQGYERITHGDSAFRELRSYGRDQFWICLLGNLKRDGDFNSFKEKVLNAKVEITGNAVTYVSLDGVQFISEHKRPLLIDGQAQKVNTRHYDTPYSKVEFDAGIMEISFGSDTIRLNFE